MYIAVKGLQPGIIVSCAAGEDCSYFVMGKPTKQMLDTLRTHKLDLAMYL